MQLLIYVIAAFTNPIILRLYGVQSEAMWLSQACLFVAFCAGSYWHAQK